MKYLICLAALAAALPVSGHSQGVGGIGQIAIIDRRSGVELVPYYYRGEYWVAGTPGATYAIEIRNRLSERLLAVTSVDGINVITGTNAGWDQAGYVFDPGQSYQITGWRKSDEQVAAFTFTASPNSYAERTGRPANVGVIGVALFREVQPPQVNAPPVMDAPYPSAGIPSQEPAPAAPEPSAPTSKSSTPLNEARAAPPPPAAYLHTTPKLGTGHGQREASYVSHTEFRRMQPEPNEVVRIRYDSFENLVAMGVIERPRRMPDLNPFPSSPQQQYVPDPPSGRRSALPGGHSF